MNIFHSFQIKLAVKRLEKLSARLKDYQEYKQAQQSIIDYLVKLGEPIVEPLLDVLRQSILYRVRISIIITLGKIGDLRAVDPIIKIIKGNDRNDRPLLEEAAIALGKIGDKRSLDALKSIINEDTSATREAWRAAANAYEKISGENLDNQRKRMENYWEKEDREYAEREAFEQWHRDGSSLL